MNKMNDLNTALAAIGVRPFDVQGDTLRAGNFAIRADLRGRIILDTLDCVCGAWVLGTMTDSAEVMAKRAHGHMRWCCS